MAKELSRKKLCRILPPTWMSPEYLVSALKEEKENQEKFCSLLPFFYIEISSAVFESEVRIGGKGAEQAGIIRLLIKEIAEERDKKSRKGLSQMNPDIVQVNNIGAQELNHIRSFYLQVVNNIQRLEE
jgi:GINS complex subunit 2